ncbi:MAG: aminopeptidase [Erysipelotrichaceae bacterium]
MKELIEKYAKLAVVMGANVQKGQVLILNTSVQAVEFSQAVVKAAYEAGAKEVIVNYSDDQISKYHYQYQAVETLMEVHPWQIDSKLDYMKQGACMLRICSDIPGIMEGIEASKIAKANQARSIAMKEVNTYTMANKIPWSIVAIPNLAWAKKVFPTKNDEDALCALWDAVLKAVHVSKDNDPIAIWKQHSETLKKREKILNDMHIKTLHFKNKLGTDLTVELVRNHIWSGCSEVSEKGIIFTPNMPTEEIFTMPYKYGVNGTVYATKPLDYNGKLIEDFHFTFENGKVIEYDAKKEKEALEMLVEFDEGSHYIGEVALVPHNSPISQSGILFLNTLFDENASCHLALGRAYPMNVKDGTSMSQEALNEAGSNDSNTHIDFMFGSEDMDISAIDENNKTIKIFEAGNFII